MVDVPVHYQNLAYSINLLESIKYPSKSTIKPIKSIKIYQIPPESPSKSTQIYQIPSKSIKIHQHPLKSPSKSIKSHQFLIKFPLFKATLKFRPLKSPYEAPENPKLVRKKVGLKTYKILEGSKKRCFNKAGICPF